MLKRSKYTNKALWSHEESFKIDEELKKYRLELEAEKKGEI